jgi:drug/metabolite transporter (DMT)-like permease
MFEGRSLLVKDILISAFGANAESAGRLIFIAASGAFFYWVFTFGLSGARHPVQGRQTQKSRRQAILRHWLLLVLRCGMGGCLLVLFLFYGLTHR